MPMDGVLNTTYITFTGYVEMQKSWLAYFLIVLTVYILIICCNVTIISLIWIHKSLHEPMYYFIAALLVNSVAFSSSVYPKLLTDFLSERQRMSFSLCLLQFHLFYSLGTAEFLLLAAMAYDRYVSICKPLQYQAIMTKKAVVIMLALAWILPICDVAVPTVLISDKKLCNVTLNGIFCNNLIYRLYCESSRQVSAYGVIMTLIFCVFPVLFIVFTYTKILIITNRESKEVRRKAAQTCLPHLLVLGSSLFLGLYDILNPRFDSNISKAARLSMTLQVIMYHPLLNPVIYGLKMKEISKHVRRLFCGPKVS